MAELKALSDIDEISAKMDGVGDKLSQFSDIFPELAMSLVNEICEDSELISKAGQMLQNNYSKSGLKIRTGKLYEAIGRPSVVFSGKIGSKWGIKITMTSSEVYKSGSSLYEVANSLNYGSVRAPKIDNKGYNFGGRAKRTIKKLVRNEKVGKRAIKSLSSRLGTTDLDTSLGKVTVTDPKNFYNLDGKQKSELIQMFVNKFYERISQFLGLGE